LRLTTALVACTQLLLAAGCAVSPPDNTLSYRPGTGVVQEVRPARVALPRPGSGAIAGSEAAGGSYGSPVERMMRPRWTEGHQLTLRMDDGSTQQVTQDSAEFNAGDRVQITPEGRVVRLAATAPKPTASAPPAVPVAPAPATASLRPGTGVVESASVVALPSSSSAGAGATAPAAPTMAYRLKMEDGTTQSIVQTGERFSVGDRVQVSGEGRLARR
jgi:outer membrane lipoprotein SlyB